MKCPLCDTRMVEEDEMIDLSCTGEEHTIPGRTHCPSCGWELGQPLDADDHVDWINHDPYKEDA